VVWDDRGMCDSTHSDTDLKKSCVYFLSIFVGEEKREFGILGF
jgi:hypothetical protein